MESRGMATFSLADSARKKRDVCATCCVMIDTFCVMIDAIRVCVLDIIASRLAR